MRKYMAKKQPTNARGEIDQPNLIIGGVFAILLIAVFVLAFLLLNARRRSETTADTQRVIDEIQERARNQAEQSSSAGNDKGNTGTTQQEDDGTTITRYEGRVKLVADNIVTLTTGTGADVRFAIEPETIITYLGNPFDAGITVNDLLQVTVAEEDGNITATKSINLLKSASPNVPTPDTIPNIQPPPAASGAISPY